MKPVSYVHPVTVIHEQFTPSLYVQRALHEFVDDDTTDFRMYATGHRVVDQADYHHSRYDLALKDVQTSLRSLGRGGIYLSGRTRLLERKNGDARLLIEPKQQSHMDAMVEILDAIPSFENVQPGPHCLYVDFARTSLARSIEKRRTAVELFGSRARHPGSQGMFVAASPTIVGRDVAMYPLHYAPSEVNPE
jgi:hypothetical protein